VKKAGIALLIVVMAVSNAGPLFAAFDTWGDMAAAMGAVLMEADGLYKTGDVDGAKQAVDSAYYQYYEKLGFEKTVMAYISGARAAEVEYQFSLIKKAMTGGASQAEVRAALDKLATFLREDAGRLDGAGESALGVFMGSFLIILREGFEANLIVGAILAYLINSGNKKHCRSVYAGSVAALGASVVMAVIFNAITSAAGGQNQEIVEGATMLLAVAVLFYVSNWMVGKAESEAWSSYIEGKVESSLGRSSAFSLAFAAFLAVFREGAEVILFYQALLAQTQSFVNMIWLGLGIGVLILVGVYIAIRKLSIRLPLKPFFLGTSILLFFMSITFLGNGIKELQEGNVIGVTPLPFAGSVDLLGIYPTAETLLPQLILLAITVVTFIVQLKKQGPKTLQKNS
jgi:high-affinity iron transporter